LFKKSHDFPHEPYNIINENAIVYVIGDLEGDSNILYRWLIQSKFIDSDLKWIASDNIYIIHCGDKLDNGIAKALPTTTLPIFPFFNRRPKLGTYFNSDMYLLLFTDYLSIVSNNHFLSILGNHEILNMQRDFRYVNLTNMLSNPNDSITLLNMFMNKDNKYQEFLNKIKPNIINYLENRRKLFKSDGIFGKLLKRRNFVIKINNLLISHAGLVTDLFKFLKSDDGLERFIKNINEQINIKQNWPSKSEFTEDDFNILYTSTPSTKSVKDFFAITNESEYTGLFKIILNTPNLSPIWNRTYVATSKMKIGVMNQCLPKDTSIFKDYIVILGHNGDKTINFCDCTETNPCVQSYNTGDPLPKWIVTDVGFNTYSYPYLEALNINYKSNIINSISVYKFPEESEVPIDIKDNREINEKLGITTTTLENFFT